jgi:hypothetical protein
MLQERVRRWAVDAIGLAVLAGVLVDYLRPELWLQPTIPAGGDTPCHYPTFLYLRDHLLPQLRLHGWYPGAYLGQPVLLYYFPLAFLLMCALSLVMPAPVAFKLGSVGGVFLLPVLTYTSFRLMRFRAPAPLLAAAGSLLFLFVEDNPIWGGTLASTFVGEFSYTYGLAFAVLFIGVAYRAYSQDRGYWAPAVVLALVALAHGYAVLWAGLSATYFLYLARRPRRTLLWLAAVAAAAFALAAFWLVPLLADWGWTTPYADPNRHVGWRNLFPPSLAVPALFALGAIAYTAIWGRRTGGADHRLLYLAHAAVVACALAAAGPALGIVDFRFVPFAHAVTAVLGGAALGLLISGLRAPGPLALAIVLATAVGVDLGSRQLRAWSAWDASGLEAKELWPAWREVGERLRGGIADPRVAVEYGRVHERAGSIRVYETLPLFTGRSTLEGVYNQASLSTHAVYYLASELDANAPNPFRSRYYSSFDPDAAVAHLRLFNVRDVVAISARLANALAARSDTALVARVPPYSLFRLDGRFGYVQPLTHEPVRSSPTGWREKAYRWFTRRPLSPAHLVFTEDPRFRLVEGDEYLAPAEVPLTGDVEVTETIEPEQITIHTSRVGRPLLVKVSYHPRWKAEGARGPYLVSPSLMMVVPEQETVRLRYTRTSADVVGAVLTLAAVAFGLWWRFVRRPGPAPRVRLSLASLACDDHHEPPRWGGVIPAAVLVVLFASRFAPRAQAGAAEAHRLHEYAVRAYEQKRYDAAAEYLRNALVAERDAGTHEGWAVMRAESLLRAGRAGEAARAFQEVLDAEPSGVYAPQALFGLAAARSAEGDRARAVEAAARLLQLYPRHPWTEHLRAQHHDLVSAVSGIP